MENTPLIILYEETGENVTTRDNKSELFNWDNKNNVLTTVSFLK